MAWDLFCRVIDNFGDVGVCWRLATGLARRGQPVRLWIDDPGPLAWMAPGGAPGVAVVPWASPAPDLLPGPVVIEAFGCALPSPFVARMAAARPKPVWINLEYLSAEPYVERSHGLLSPQFSGPGVGLKKWFFYPGFTPATGGLLGTDGDPAQAHDAHQSGHQSGHQNAHQNAHQTAHQTARPAAQQSARAWASAQAWGADAGERAVTVFCYPNPALPALLQALAGPPTVLRVPPGPVLAALRETVLPAGMRLQPLPWLAQPDFDRLLAAADFNLVRGEDSFVQAQCHASAPFLWQIYPQHDGAHGAKLDAFLGLYLAGSPAALAGPVRAAFRAFNGLAPWPAALPDVPGGAVGGAADWAALQHRWLQQLGTQTGLCSRLRQFVDQRLAQAGV